MLASSSNGPGHGVQEGATEQTLAPQDHQGWRQMRCLPIPQARAQGGPARDSPQPALACFRELESPMLILVLTIAMHMRGLELVAIEDEPEHVCIAGWAPHYCRSENALINPSTRLGNPPICVLRGGSAPSRSTTRFLVTCTVRIPHLYWRPHLCDSTPRGYESQNTNHAGHRESERRKMPNWHSVPYLHGAQTSVYKPANIPAEGTADI